MIKKKTYRKPNYKEQLLSRKNVWNNTKFFFLKKKKWERFKFFSRRNLKFFKRYRFYDQSKLKINKFSSFGNKFKKQFKNFLIKLKVLKILYGESRKNKIKSFFINTSKTNFNKSQKYLTINPITVLEKRLDWLLTRAKFSVTPKQAKQMIYHGHVLINNKKPSSHRYFLNYGDIIQIKRTTKSRDLVKQNIMKSSFWPIPPSYIKINYKTLTIVAIKNRIQTNEIPSTFSIGGDFIKNKIRFK